MIRPRILLSIVSALTLLATVGCSRVSFFYGTADFFIEQYADDYLSLDATQRASMRPALVATMAQHRREELPYLVAFFDGFLQATQRGMDSATLECLVDAFEDIYRRHARIAIGLAVPVLASLRSEQIRTLERKFADEKEEDEREDRDDASKPQRRDRKRAERWGESAEWWIGPLTGKQQEIVSEVTSSLPDASADWTAYRGARRAGLIRLLDAGAGEAEIHRYLTEWLVGQRDLPASLERVRLELRRGVVDLFLRMDGSFSDAQRIHFEERLSGLRDDFLDLQKRPRSAPLQCGAQP